MKLRIPLLIGTITLLGFSFQDAQPEAAVTLSVPAGDVSALVDAIKEANASDGSTTIDLEGGTYTLSQGADSRLPLGPRSHLLIDSSVIINGNGSVIENSGSQSCDFGTSDDIFRLMRVSDNNNLALNDLTMRNSCGNAAGALVTDDGTRVRIQNSTFANNEGAAGAIAAVGSLQISNSTFVNNRGTSNGGAISTVDRVTIINSTFYGNSAPVGGALSTGNAPASIVHSTIVNNAANRGGGISSTSFRSRMTLEASIVASNDGGNCSLRSAGAFRANGANLSDDGTCPGFSFTDTDPQLDAFDDHGGPTMTVSLAANSPAIDAMDECSVETDQRGMERPQDGDGDGEAGCDIGAFELSR